MPREMIIGTSDAAAEANAATHLLQETPALSAVEEHVQRLRVELCGTRPVTNSGYAAHVQLPASDLTRIALLVDLLDQLRYWAVEEATTFVSVPSRLAEADAPEAVVACLCSGRPQLIAQALTVAQPMLRHRQTASELRRVLRDVSGYQRIHNKSHNSVVVDAGDGDPVLVLLAEIMVRHAGAAPLLSEAMSTATAVVQEVLRDLSQGEMDDVVGRRVHSVVDALCATPLVFAMESAMRRFANTVQLQVSGVAFFAALVDLPALTEHVDSSLAKEPKRVGRSREEEVVEAVDGENDDCVVVTTSMADVVAHSDGVVEVLHAALQRHHQHLTLCRNVLHVWCVCAQLPSCRVALQRHGVYAAVLRQLCEIGPYTQDVFQAAAEVVGYFIPLLDALQRRSLLLTLRRLLHRRPQLDMIELVLALLVALLTVLPQHSVRERTHAAGGGGGGGDPFARYATCPQPPASPPAAPPSSKAVRHADVAEVMGKAGARCRGRRTQLSPLYWQPSIVSSLHYGYVSTSNSSRNDDDADTWYFMLHSCAIPQLVSGVREYFLRCEVLDVDDAAEVQRVCALADAVLSFF